MLGSDKLGLPAELGDSNEPTFRGQYRNVGSIQTPDAADTREDFMEISRRQSSRIYETPNIWE